MIKSQNAYRINDIMCRSCRKRVWSKSMNWQNDGPPSHTSNLDHYCQIQKSQLTGQENCASVNRSTG